MNDTSSDNEWQRLLQQVEKNGNLRSQFNSQSNKTDCEKNKEILTWQRQKILY